MTPFPNAVTDQQQNCITRYTRKPRVANSSSQQLISSSSWGDIRIKSQRISLHPGNTPATLFLRILAITCIWSNFGTTFIIVLEEGRGGWVVEVFWNYIILYIKTVQTDK